MDFELLHRIYRFPGWDIPEDQGEETCIKLSSLFTEFSKHMVSLVLYVHTRCNTLVLNDLNKSIIFNDGQWITSIFIDNVISKEISHYYELLVAKR